MASETDLAMAMDQKPHVHRCGTHWACEFYSAIGEEIPSWWCFGTWAEALERALKVATQHKERLAKLKGPH